MGYLDRRGKSLTTPKFLEIIQQPGKIILDSRHSSEYEGKKLSVLGVSDNSTIVHLDYNNFAFAQKFFGSFDPKSEFYDKANDDTDLSEILDAFHLEELNLEQLKYGWSSYSYKLLPEEVRNTGEDFILVCGRRGCGCRWSLMYRLGFKGMVYYGRNVNDLIE